MSFSSHYRPLSPSGGRHHMAGPRASTGTVQLGSSYDQYEMPRSRYDYYDGYPSDAGYTSAYNIRPSHRSMIEAQPVSSQKYRDPGQPVKRRTEYTVQPQTRHRSNTTSATDMYDTPVRLAVPSSHHRPTANTGRGRSPSPLPLGSKHHLVPYSSHHSARHRRVYSTDYASDTGRLDPHHSVKHRNGHHSHGSHLVHPSSGPRRHRAYDGLKNGDDIDDFDAYSYTTPREQFDRDYPVKPRRPTARSSVGRPLSVDLTEEPPRWLTRKDHRHHGPPPTSWGFDKIDREGRPRNSARGMDDHRDVSRTRGGAHDRTLVAMPHESDDGYDSYSDSRPRRHRHRSSRHESGRYDRDDRSPRAHNSVAERALPALGTAALGNGYADMSDYDHRLGRRHPRLHGSDRDIESPPRSSRDLIDGTPPNSERSKQLYLEPDSRSRHHRSRSRQHSRRHTDSDEDRYTDDEDLRKYRREPAAHMRRRHSSTDTSSDEARPSRRDPRDHSRHRSSRRELENGPSSQSRHSPSTDSKDDFRKPVTVSPPVSAPKEPEPAPKGILKPPRPSFPEEPNPIREGVAPLKDATKQGIPPGARWTKIDRRLVNPAALEAGNERFEERSDYVIVLRVLSKEEIQAYAVKTQEIRDTLEKEYIREKRRRLEEAQRHGRRGEESSSDDEDEDEHEQLKLEAPRPPGLEQEPPSFRPSRPQGLEQERVSLPSRPRDSSTSMAQPERMRMSPSAAQV
ncbi:uncharacterized protein N7459_008379 [Penicillium hispanicum]|uniref:uncharacterized protein n=1 Tax=Penicillium hispanicum TaxID=1080232 RepID=UPI002541EEDE|nr:uncharacterized protein N7459_008379 [Penicillium hispanicum]KAJ5573952.1 hypothetical protein N7459_008379 [Penicillium hispanicum]